MPKKTDKSFQFRGKTIFGSDKSELLTFLENALKGQNPPLLVFTPNPEQLVLAEHDQVFNLELQQADLLLPDGVGLMWASRFLGTPDNPPLTERLPGRVVVEELLRLAGDHQLRVLVIGGRDYAQADHFDYRGLTCHWTEGYLDIGNQTEGEEVALWQLMEKLQPDLVFVAFGAPQQERWLIRHRELLAKNRVKIAMAVGGTFDYLLNKVPRPPAWVAKHGLEWLFRLMTQPQRFFRQLRLITFVWLVVKEKWRPTK